MPGEPPSPRALITLGMTLVGFIVLGLIGGIAVDSWMDSKPTATMIGLFVGVFGAVAYAIVEFRKFLR